MADTCCAEIDENSVRIGAVDPGKINPAVWIGVLHMDTSKIETNWGAAGAEITDAAAETRALNASSAKKKSEKPTICEIGAEIGQLIVDQCEGLGIKDLEGIVVETPSTFNGRGAFVNVGAAVGAGATYGYLCGSGLCKVQMSHSRTKSKAMEYFAGKLGITLEQHVVPADKTKNRLVNKRNSKKVIIELLKFSEDSVGSDLLEKHREKKDDIADAILLACGLGLDLRMKKKRTSPRVV